MRLGKPGGLWAKPLSMLLCSMGQWRLLREASSPKTPPSTLNVAAGAVEGITSPCTSGLAFGRAGACSKDRAQAEAGSFPQPPAFPGPEEPGRGLRAAGGTLSCWGSAPGHAALLTLGRLSGMGLPPCWGTSAISLPGTATWLLGDQVCHSFFPPFKSSKQELMCSLSKKS